MAQDRDKRIARMHKMRDRVGEWAARYHPDALAEGIRCWIGSHEPHEDLVRVGVSFALIAPVGDAPSLLERFRAAAGKLPRAEREVVDDWSRAWFGVFEIVTVIPGEGLRLEDVVTGISWDVKERAASYQLEVGQWIAAFLMPVEGHIELEGTSVIMGPPSRIDAVQAYLAARPHEGPLPPEVSRRTARPVIQAIREAERTPQFVNGDGDPIELLTATLDLTWKKVQTTLRKWDDADVGDDFASVVGPSPEQDTPVVLGTFRPDGAKTVTLDVNSRGRLAKLAALWEARVGKPFHVLSEDVADTRLPPSDPRGRRVVLDTQMLDTDDPEGAELDFRTTHALDWPHRPIPALDGLTPTEAAAAGRSAEVRALLPTDLPPVLEAHLRDALGIGGGAVEPRLPDLRDLPVSRHPWEVALIEDVLAIDDVDVEGMLIVVERGSGMIRGVGPIVVGDSLLQVLRPAFSGPPAPGRPARPQRLLTSDPALAERLRELVEPAGIGVEVVDSTPDLDVVVASMVEHFQGLSAPGITTDLPLWAETFETLCALAPWRSHSEHVLFRFDGVLDAAVAVLLGNAGEQRGVSLYPTEEDYELFLDVAYAEEPEALLDIDVLNLWIDAADDLSEEEVDACREAGLVSSGGLYPQLVALGGGRPAAAAPDGQRAMLAAIQAIVGLVSADPRLEGGPRRVQTCLGGIEVSFEREDEG
ncbi:MAG: hypothetical protein H6737_24285 [Alphaproteobacteria bacterium]|nr:hypothetical protein [Alphaproteobacteria bacterium]